MGNTNVREKYLSFFKLRNHKIIPSAPLVPENDPTTLFTSSGMQPMITYLLGKPHPLGKRITDSQLCVRTTDSAQVGDNRHLTLFEMLGNWSLGDYFKQDQLTWYWEFLTTELALPKEKLYVSIFKGNKYLPRDTKSEKIWLSLGLKSNHIFEYDLDNWWSRSGPPGKMPQGEPGGPDSEVFFEFTHIKHNTKFAKHCHPNCDCGRFLEIGNSVFMQYKKEKDGSLAELPEKNVDFGGGLERLTATLNNEPDVFKTNLFFPLIEIIERTTKNTYQDSKKTMRIIADHIKASAFMASQGIIPSNKQQGYIMRALIRRSIIKMHQLGLNNYSTLLTDLSNATSAIYKDIYPEISRPVVLDTLIQETDKFQKTLHRGLNQFNKLSHIGVKQAFDLFQTYGFPFEITQELLAERGKSISKNAFDIQLKKHQQLSRTLSSGMFKGGLANHTEITTKYHTATHLLHQALRDVLGDYVKQAGSNITSDRLRFDFTHSRPLTEKELQEITNIINQKISQGLKVSSVKMSKQKAIRTVTVAMFADRYPEMVTVYSIGNYSREICGGPHVTDTSQIGKIKLTRQRSVGAGVRRVYLELSKNEI